jgi:hypothetical protein
MERTRGCVEVIDLADACSGDKERSAPVTLAPMEPNPTRLELGDGAVAPADSLAIVLLADPTTPHESTLPARYVPDPLFVRRRSHRTLSDIRADRSVLATAPIC